MIPTRAVVLCVGEQIDHADRADAAGSWWVADEVPEAYELARALLEEDDARRVVLDRGVVARAPGRWWGPVVERVRRYALMGRLGSAVVTDDPYQNLLSRGLVDRAARWWDERSAPHLWRVADASARAPLTLGWQPRTNVTPFSQTLHGRDDALAALAESADTPRRRATAVHGGAGVGKSALLGALLTRELTQDGAMSAWRVEARGVREVTRLAGRLAQLWNLTLRGGPPLWRAQITVALEEMASEVWFVLEDVDDLDAEARAWLDTLILSTPNVHWFQTSRSPEAVPDAEGRVTLEPLHTEHIARILLAHVDPSVCALPDDFARVLAWADACAGYPANAHLVARTPRWWTHSPHARALDPGRLHVQAYGALDGQTRAALDALAAFAGSASMAEASAWLERALELGPMDARRRLEAVIASGWVTRDHAGALVLNAGMRAVASPPPPDDPRWRDLLDGWVARWSRELTSSREREAMAAWRRHAADVEAYLRRALDHQDARAIDLFVRTHVFFDRERFAMDHEALLSSARALADASGDRRAAVKLDFYRAILADADLSGTRDTHDLLDRCVAAGPELVGDDHLWWSLRLRRTRTIEERSGSGADALAALEDFCDALPRERYPAHGVWADALRAQYTEDPERALEIALGAVEVAEALGAGSLINQAYFALHRVYMNQGALPEARAAALETLSPDRYALPSQAPMMIASLGYADLSAGDLQAALVAFDTARSISARAGEAFARTNCTYLLGVAHARALDWPHAKLHLERALAWNKESENVWNIHQCEAWLGAALAGLGAPDRGEALLEGALAFFEEHDEERMIHVCGHLRALTEVARAGWVEPDPPRVERAWARAQEAPEGARVQPAWGTLEAAYDHARALLEAAPDTTLEHNPDRTRFRLEGGDVINLARSHTARAVLHALLDDLAARPGEPIAPMDLFARAWPGQNIEQRAALMRLYVTINKLRKIGLDGIIETLDQGYRVRPHVRVEAVAEGL